MADSLRDRIAYAIREVDDMRVCKLSNADISFIVDAVIAELGLRRETVGLIHRYVTKWDDGGAE